MSKPSKGKKAKASPRARDRSKRQPRTLKERIADQMRKILGKHYASKYGVR